MESQLGSPEAVLRVVATAVCAAGSKSCSHAVVLLQRYSALLARLQQQCGAEEGQGVLLDVLGGMYGRMPTRLTIALARYDAGWGCGGGGMAEGGGAGGVACMDAGLKAST
jgi:hypothetical protein